MDKGRERGAATIFADKKVMIIRIPLTEKNCNISPIPLDDNSGNDSETPGTGEPDGTGSSGSTNASTALDGFALPDATFTLTPGKLTAYESSRYSHPVASVNISVPDADLPLVRNWFGNATSGVNAASDTLTKRMTEAVTDCIGTYLTEAARAALFTAPFRVGYALRLADGTHVCRTTPRLLSPNYMAPLMLIRESLLSGNTLQTLTEIVNTPTALTAALPAFSLPQGTEAAVTHLDFYATRQTSLLTGDEKVAGVRTYSYFGENLHCWHYPRLAEDLVREVALADNSFRIIASVPIADAVGGTGGVSLPLDMKNLDNWTDFPLLDSTPDNPDIPDTPEEPEIPHTHIRLVTEPLDLGSPERAKKIRALTVCGIFTRITDEIEVTLLGSHHRDRWHRIASSRGPHIRYLRTIRYRWLRVELTAPRTSTFDALTFEMA